MSIRLSFVTLEADCYLAPRPHTRSRHFSNDVPLPWVAASPSGRDRDSQENLSQFGSCLSGPGLILQLVIRIKQEVQDTRDKARPRGFTVPSSLLETNTPAFHQSCHPFQGPGRGPGLLWFTWARGRQRGVWSQPVALVCGQRWANASKNASELLIRRGAGRAELLALGDTDYNASTSFCHQRANFSSLSHRNATRQVNMISKEKLSAGVFTSLSCPCCCTESPTFGERVTYCPTWDTMVASY